MKFSDYDFSKFEEMALQEMRSLKIIKRLSELHNMPIKILQEVVRLKQDLPRSIAAYVFGIDYKKVTNAQREDIKFLNYHIMYGNWCS